MSRTWGNAWAEFKGSHPHMTGNMTRLTDRQIMSRYAQIHEKGTTDATVRSLFTAVDDLQTRLFTHIQSAEITPILPPGVIRGFEDTRTILRAVDTSHVILKEELLNYVNWLEGISNSVASVLPADRTGQNRALENAVRPTLPTSAAASAAGVLTSGMTPRLVENEGTATATATATAASVESISKTRYDHTLRRIPLQEVFIRNYRQMIRVSIGTLRDTPRLDTSTLEGIQQLRNFQGLRKSIRELHQRLTTTTRELEANQALVARYEASAPTVARTTIRKTKRSRRQKTVRARR
jgi:hypothetical protein